VRTAGRTGPGKGTGLEVRIATFNILNGRSLEDGEVDVDRLGTAVKTLDADVLGLQEVDRNQPRSQGADLTAVAAEAMGAVDSRFVAALSGTPGGPWTVATGEERADSAGYGVALLSRYPVVSWRVVRLPAIRAGLPMRLPGTRTPVWVSDEPRVAVAAVLAGPFGEFTVCTTHLSFLPGWNGAQLRRLVRSLAGAREPLALIGDLNMQAARAARVSGLRSLASVATFPAPRPRRQLDHVLVRGGLAATAPAEAVRLPVSDHRALVVPCGPA
jgi:endonuclease/exonuclease/phosphatase family metal-dependent hydrolase